MQRFGTASIPTHLIGLALLQSDWQKAVALILQPRHGEHPEVCAARRAWLDERDLDKALQLMPRRLVAERAILESYKKQKGDTRNAMGALSTVSVCKEGFPILIDEITDSAQPEAYVHPRIPVIRLERNRL